MTVSIEELRLDAAKMTVWQRHRFAVLIVGVILTSLLLVSVGLGLYYSSGASQVDLSLPGFHSIQKEASRGNVDDSFPATGKLDDKAFKLFESKYANHAKQVVGVDSFDPEALDIPSLQLLNTTQAPEAQ